MGNLNRGHEWLSLLMEDGKRYAFDAAQDQVAMKTPYRFAKVFRYSFAALHKDISDANDIPPVCLKKQIAQNEYENTPEAPQIEGDTIAILENPRVERNVTSKRNRRLHVTTEFVSLGNDIASSKVITNIFTNPYFPLIQAPIVLSGKSRLIKK